MVGFRVLIFRAYKCLLWTNTADGDEERARKEATARISALKWMNADTYGLSSASIRVCRGLIAIGEL